MFVYKENESVGPIKFGMSYNEVREVLCSTSISSTIRRRTITFQKTPHLVSQPDAPERDVFEDLEVIVYYDVCSGRCSAVEFFGETSPTFRSKELLGEQSIDILRVWLDSIGGECEVQDNFVTSYKFGIDLKFITYVDADQYKHVKDYPPKDVAIFSKEFNSDLER